MTSDTATHTADSLPLSSLADKLRSIISPSYRPWIVHPASYIPDRPKVLTLWCLGPGLDNYAVSPSIECLQIQALLRFNAIDFDTKYTNNTHASPNGKLPFLATPSGHVVLLDKIVDYLKDNNLWTLTSTCSSDTLALVSMVQAHLMPILTLGLWVERQNYPSTTQDRVLQTFPYPLSSFMGLMYRKLAYEQLERRSNSIIDSEQMYARATKALNCLLEYLGDSEYFGGQIPDELDAIAFACIHLILNAATNCSELRSLLTLGKKSARADYSKLIDYSQRIWDTYFSNQPAHQ
ncbi:Metaxin-2 [Spiromyces aspiralis]|uniref:Metaxin-2 n=1 Tax=Spiromyces aspiralis TaxID=68401 RepID=A0ACC1HT69_9FUNG|nr:Metaxin-2 [Spiromyces aspiralis]